MGRTDGNSPKAHETAAVCLGDGHRSNTATNERKVFSFAQDAKGIAPRGEADWQYCQGLKKCAAPNSNAIGLGKSHCS
jgi:hypothetical protein